MATIIDGKALAARIRAEIADEAARLPRKAGLAVILVGNDPASCVYVANKQKDCVQCGFASFEYKLSEETREEELLRLIEELNRNDTVDGILVQLPLPGQIDQRRVIEAIDPDKDVDAFHPVNVGKMVVDEPGFQPCTPAGVMEMFRCYDISLAGKLCVMIGRSNIVGKPMGLLMLRENGTVVYCHSKTRDLAEITRKADILVSAVGKQGFITADMVKEGAVVIDVSINRDAETGKLVGDAVFDEVEKKASFITPVPGGVGPMTRAMLMKNVLTAAKRHLGIQDE